MRHAAILAFALAGQAAAAQDFPAKINLIVGFAAGQATDVIASEGADAASQRLTAEPTFDQAARFYATHLPRFLPGKPQIEVRLAPGAASLVAARLVAQGPADGSSIGLLGPATVLAPFSGAAFDSHGLAWIGARQRDTDVCFLRSSAPVRTLDDLRTRDAYVAALGAGSKSWIYPRALNAFAGARLRVVSGYSGAFEVSRALETGETDAWCGWSMGTLRNRHPDLLREGKIRLLVQFTAARAGARMTIPAAGDLPTDPAQRQAMRVLERQTLFGGFALAASARVKPLIVQQLRDGFRAMLADADALADAARLGLEIDVVPGAELQAEADRIAATDAAAAATLRSVLRGP